MSPTGSASSSRSAWAITDLTPLWLGETDLVTPAFIREAAKKALDEGRTFYSGARGIRPLRAALSDYYARLLDVSVDARRISLPGASTLAMVTALQCLVETGDNVVIVSPVWPSIFQAVTQVGGENRFVRLDEDWQASPPRWRLDMQKLFDACDARTKAIFLCSPGNPTGWVATREEQQAVLDFARARGIAIIGDEVYGALVFAERAHAPSFLEITTEEDDLFVVGGFSKAWAMTGWRIGWLVHPSKLDRQMNVMCIANNTGPAAFAQYGALAALSPEGDALPRRDAGALPRRPRGGAGLPRRAEPHPLDPARGRLLRLSAHRRAHRQPGLREAAGARGARWRGAGLGLRPAGRHGQRFLHPHLLWPGPAAPARRAGPVGEGCGGALGASNWHFQGIR